jgi:hypothetical protein
LAKLIVLAQPLESSSGEAEREAFLALQQILAVLDSGKNEPINVFPFFDKFCRYIGTTFSDFEEMDIFLVWDYLVKLITLVIPPLREIFMGRLSLSLDEHAWHSLTTRCVHAQFSQSVQSLEDFIKSTLHQFDKDYYNDIDLYQHRTSLESIKNFNAIILGRSPEILAFAVESAHLPSSLRFLDALSKNPSKLKPPGVIRFPASFNLSMRDGVSTISKKQQQQSNNSTSSEADEENSGNIYDLAAVVTLEGQSCDVAQAYYRYVQEGEAGQWFKGSGATHDQVDSSKAIERNYFNTSDTRKVHPRLLIYAKRGISVILDHLKDFVTKGGQLRSKGDATFATAETPEHYDEAKQYYEEAIAHDASLRTVLQERLNSLEQIEKNQKAQSYENQADLSLGKRRFKEACDLYKLAMRSAVANSSIYNRIREKEDYMMRIISLEIANHLTEKGEECLKSGSYAQSRENFAQALKLNPNYTHLQSIINGIDKLITQQTSAQKVSEANQAMKIGRYKYANQLFQEAVALVPERESALKPVLDSLVVLMQGEDALMKQRSGLIALEDKKYATAIALISEAITLLPPESITEHAFFLCDRAQVYFEMKDYLTSISDCQAALELRPELAIAYLRLGSAQFELERFDEALQSYEKAMRNDPSLADQVKTKIRQVNTAKEVQQRKEREAERARVREEEQKRLEEKRAREERAKKERLEKQKDEQAEKAERLLMKEEEKLIRLVEQRPEVVEAKTKTTSSSANSKESVKDRQKREKAEKEATKAQEKEKQKQEKEKERERLRLEREQKLREEQHAKEEELKKRREFAAEIERAEAKLKEAEREKELEREKTRIEREKLLVEREKAKQEKNERKKQQLSAASSTAPAIGATVGENEKKTAGKKDSIAAVKETTPEVKPTAAEALMKNTHIVSSHSASSSSHHHQVDSEFPSLGSEKKKSLESTHTPTSSVTSGHHNKPSTVNKNAVPAVSPAPTKWSALLSNEEELQNKKPPSSGAAIVSPANNKKTVPGAAGSAAVVDYSDHFPTLSGGGPAGQSSSVPVSVNNNNIGEPVLSSGELKALISNKLNEIPSLALPATASRTATAADFGLHPLLNHSHHNQQHQSHQQSGGVSSSSWGTLSSLENNNPPGIGIGLGLGSGSSSLLSSVAAGKPPDNNSNLLLNDGGLFLNHQNNLGSHSHLHSGGIGTGIGSGISGLGIGGLGLSTGIGGIGDSNPFQSSLSRSQSKSYENPFLSPPGDNNANTINSGNTINNNNPLAVGSSAFSFSGGSSSLPSMGEDAPPAFSRAVSSHSADLGGNDNAAAVGRTSSRFSSLFGSSTEGLPLGIGSSSEINNNNNPFLSNLSSSHQFGHSTAGVIGNSGLGLGLGLETGPSSNSSWGGLGTMGMGIGLGSDLDKGSSGMGGFSGFGGLGGNDNNKSESLFGGTGNSSSISGIGNGNGSNLQKFFSGFSDNASSSVSVSGAPLPLMTGSSSGLGTLDSFGLGLSTGTGPGAGLGGVGNNSVTTGLGLWDTSHLSGLSGLGGGLTALPLSTLGTTGNTMNRKYDLIELGKRLEDEQVNDSVTFPSLGKLATWGVLLFRWAVVPADGHGHGQEWIEFALFIPEAVLAALGSQTALTAAASKCRCEIVFKELVLRGHKQVFAVLGKDPFATSVVLSINHLLESILIVLTQLSNSASSSSHNSITGTNNSQQLHSNNNHKEKEKEFSVADSMVDSLMMTNSSSTAGIISSSEKENKDKDKETNSKDNNKDSITTLTASSPVVSSSPSPAPLPALQLPATSSPSTNKVAGGILPAINKNTGTSTATTAASVVTAASSSKNAIKGNNSPAPASASASVSSSSPAVPTTATVTSSSSSTAIVRRFLEIPSELIGLVIGHQGRKIKELAVESGSKVQFRTSKTSEKEGKPGVLEISGASEAVDRAVEMVADLLNSVGRDFKEVSSAPGEKPPATTTAVGKK